MMTKSTNDTLFMQNEYRQIDQYQFTTEITYKGSVVTFSKILTTLVIIDASSNGFSGVIPRSFGELVLLCGLNLSNNAFTGMIPSQLGALHQLESLDLSSNDLSGVIPVELAWLVTRIGWLEECQDHVISRHSPIYLSWETMAFVDLHCPSNVTTRPQRT
jgi:hypothetical protein